MTQRKDKKLTFMMLNTTDGIYPLVPLYLAGYARLDPEIRDCWDFACYSGMNTISPDQLVSDMEEQNADVYAFSCYVWNMGLIKKVIDTYLKKKPETHIILGGPQVTRQGKRYLCDRYENLVICNGEGERVFRNYLKEISKEQADFSQVKGLSFYRNNDLTTNPYEDKIKALDELPSPFQNQIFGDADYHYVDMETSRGCPFTCRYCYWNSSIGSKPARFSHERMISDILHLARNRTYCIRFTDANLGLFPQDLEIIRFIAECKKEYGFPKVVEFCPSKIHLQRVFEIAETLRRADIIYTCEIGVQTLSATSSERIGRKSDINHYRSLLEKLNSKGISSYVELIWPLPGETLDSFRQGIVKLCEIQSDVIFVFRLLLMNNVSLQDSRTEYGIVTTQSLRVAGEEEEVVIQTNEVSHDELMEGFEFIFAATVLHSMRSLRVTARYLNENHIETYHDLFLRFLDFARSRVDMPGIEFIEQVKNVFFDLQIYGNLLYEICHEKRDAFDSALFEFASSQSWWADPTAQLYFEIDLLNRGFVRDETNKNKNYHFKNVHIVETRSDGYVVEVLPALVPQIREMIGASASFDSNLIEIDHNQPRIINKDTSLEQLKRDCIWMVFYSSSYLPKWRDYEKRGIG